MDICNNGTSDTLHFGLGRPPFTAPSELMVNVPNLIRTNEWCHIAAVTGPQGVQLYFNGGLLATDPYPGSFASLKGDAHNYLGRSNWKDPPYRDEDFDGQIGEVRVWKLARTAAQIHETMFQQLTGKEAGLVVEL